MSQQYKGRGLLQITGKQTMAILGSPLSTITLTGASGSSSSWADTLTLNLNSQHDSIKKFEMYESPVDVLVLSCAIQRMRENKQYGHKILDKAVVESACQEDTLKAASIRDYYSKKIMMGKLNEKLHMTPFREDMNRFIHSDGFHFKDKDLGMICYLPTFYDYDISLDGVKSQIVTNQGFRDMDKKGTPRTLGTEANLTPLKKIVRKTRNREVYQYWMKDDKLDAGVVLHLTKDNTLLHIWEHLFNNSKVLQIKGSFARNFNDDFEYFSVTNWNLKMD